jgi:regulator of extracellular matrix RemA (YlzA/DUF370 family)
MLADATQGERTRPIIITDSDQVIFPAVQVETLKQRVRGGDEA